MNVREHPLQLTDPPSRQISPYVDIFASGILKLVFKDFRKTESCKPLAASYMVNISCASASLFLGMAFLRAVFAANCYFFGQIYPSFRYSLDFFPNSDGISQHCHGKDVSLDET